MMKASVGSVPLVLTVIAGRANAQTGYVPSTDLASPNPENAEDVENLDGTSSQSDEFQSLFDGPQAPSFDVDFQGDPNNDFQQF